MNEVNKFFEGLPSQDKTEVDIFNEKPAETVTAPEKVDDAEVEEGRKNRRHRRLEEQLTRERESNIALNARIQALSEFNSSKKDSTEPIDSDFVRLFGDNDNGKEASRILERKLAQIKEEATQTALERYEERQQEVAQEQKMYESVIDSELESLEDTYNVDLTSDSPKARKTRREFLEMVQKFSPKDEDGNVTSFADFGSTFEEYQARQEKPDASRNKELAARSMQSSNASTQQTTSNTERDYLRSIGIRGI